MFSNKMQRTAPATPLHAKDNDIHSENCTKIPNLRKMVGKVTVYIRRPMASPICVQYELWACASPTFAGTLWQLAHLPLCILGRLGMT
jgi:hypothetical protein